MIHRFFAAILLVSLMAAGQACAETPAPEAAPPQPETRQSFTVEFDTGQSDVTRAMVPVIQNAIAAARAAHVELLTVIGHADDSEPAATRAALSQKRAEAVKGFLIANGFRASRITALGVGREPLLSPTDEGSQGAATRRVEILLR